MKLGKKIEDKVKTSAVAKMLSIKTQNLLLIRKMRKASALVQLAKAEAPHLKGNRQAVFHITPRGTYYADKSTANLLEICAQKHGFKSRTWTTATIAQKVFGKKTKTPLHPVQLLNRTVINTDEVDGGKEVEDFFCDHYIPFDTQGNLFEVSVARQLRAAAQAHGFASPTWVSRRELEVYELSAPNKADSGACGFYNMDELPPETVRALCAYNSRHHIGPRGNHITDLSITPLLNCHMTKLQLKLCVWTTQGTATRVFGCQLKAGAVGVKLNSATLYNCDEVENGQVISDFFSDPYVPFDTQGNLFEVSVARQLRAAAQAHGFAHPTWVSRRELEVYELSASNAASGACGFYNMDELPPETVRALCAYSSRHHIGPRGNHITDLSITPLLNRHMTKLQLKSCVWTTQGTATRVFGCQIKAGAVGVKSDLMTLYNCDEVENGQVISDFFSDPYVPFDTQGNLFEVSVARQLRAAAQARGFASPTWVSRRELEVYELSAPNKADSGACGFYNMDELPPETVGTLCAYSSRHHIGPRGNHITDESVTPLLNRHMAKLQLKSCVWTTQGTATRVFGCQLKAGAVGVKSDLMTLYNCDEVENGQVISDFFSDPYVPFDTQGNLFEVSVARQLRAAAQARGFASPTWVSRRELEVYELSAPNKADSGACGFYNMDELPPETVGTLCAYSSRHHIGPRGNHITDESATPLLNRHMTKLQLKLCVWTTQGTATRVFGCQIKAGAVGVKSDLMTLYNCDEVENGQVISDFFSDPYVPFDTQGNLFEVSVARQLRAAAQARGFASPTWVSRRELEVYELSAPNKADSGACGFYNMDELPPETVRALCAYSSRHHIGPRGNHITDESATPLLNRHMTKLQLKLCVWTTQGTATRVFGCQIKAGAVGVKSDLMTLYNCDEVENGQVISDFFSDPYVPFDTQGNLFEVSVARQLRAAAQARGFASPTWVSRRELEVYELSAPDEADSSACGFYNMDELPPETFTIFLRIAFLGRQIVFPTKFLCVLSPGSYACCYFTLDSLLLSKARFSSFGCFVVRLDEAFLYFDEKHSFVPGLSFGFESYCFLKDLGGADIVAIDPFNRQFSKEVEDHLVSVLRLRGLPCCCVWTCSDVAMLLGDFVIPHGQGVNLRRSDGKTVEVFPVCLLRDADRILSFWRRRVPQRTSGFPFSRADQVALQVYSRKWGYTSLLFVSMHELLQRGVRACGDGVHLEDGECYHNQQELDHPQAILSEVITWSVPTQK